MRRNDILQWLRANEIIIDDDDAQLTDEHGLSAESRGQPLQHDQQEQISSEENCVGGDKHENEDPELSGEQRFLAEGSDPPPQHDQQERASSEEPGLGDAQHARSELPDAPPGMGDADNQNDAELTDEQGPSSSSSSRSSSEVEAESEDECPLHDRVDNYRSAAKDDRRQVYMWTYARAPEMSHEVAESSRL